MDIETNVGGVAVDSTRLLDDYVSGGRNPNWQLTCGFPLCRNFEKGHGSGGWCVIRDGKPSVSITGGCDRHSYASDGIP